jgi:hypothetical protein
MKKKKDFQKTYPKNDNNLMKGKVHMYCSKYV